MTGRNLAASIRARLLNHARQTKLDFNLILTRFAIERMLYRISISKYADQYLLKGALLFDLWFDIPHRPTRDIDFLGFGAAEQSYIDRIFKEICSIDVQDGVQFSPTSVHVAEIRKDANYAGMRVTLLATIDGARCQLQIDIGFGDAVTPQPEDAEFPVILPELDAPRLRVYPRYTVVAEKFEALTSLGIANSRMKDYFDLWILAQHTEFDGETLRSAIQATFDRRSTALPRQLPFGLTIAFSQDTQKQMQWQAFLQKNRLQALNLNEVVDALSTFMLPVIIVAGNNTSFPSRWQPGGSWLPTVATEHQVENISP